MVEPNVPPSGEDESQRKRKPNWVEIWTFIVLVITLAIVVWYASEAHRSNTLTLQAIETNTRPFIKVDFKPETFALRPAEEDSFQNTVSIQFTIENTGKLPAPARVQAGAEWETSERSKAPDKPTPNSNVGSRFLFPQQDSGLLTALGSQMT